MLEDFSSNVESNNLVVVVLNPLLEAQLADNATYSALLKNGSEVCFFVIQLTSLSPRELYPPEVLFEYQASA
ncbi:hypothetical protein Tco_0003333 [Tanacetum coccineum]